VSIIELKGGKLSFADFLDVMHSHSVKEKVPKEIIEAFRASDWNRTGQIASRDLKHILCRWGEALDHKELELLFRETNISGPSLKYEDFIRIICAPIPDY
jgi:Ca2+-binding EF-hand superfamily protein